METPTKQVKKPQPGLPGEEEEIIELTQIVEDGPSEVVLELSSLEEELDSLDLGSLGLSGDQEAEEAAPPGDDLGQNLLSSTAELVEAAGLMAGFATETAEPFEADLSQKIKADLSEEEIRNLVREVVQETVERLARELFPHIALEAINREIEVLKKTLAEGEEATLA